MLFAFRNRFQHCFLNSKAFAWDAIAVYQFVEFRIHNPGFISVAGCGRRIGEAVGGQGGRGKCCTFPVVFSLKLKDFVISAVDDHGQLVLTVQQQAVGSHKILVDLYSFNFRGVVDIDPVQLSRVAVICNEKARWMVYDSIQPDAFGFK